MNRQDIDQLVSTFRSTPSVDTYNIINSWYEGNVRWFQDVEYMTCIYLFLLGANIHFQYQPFTKDQHFGYIKTIRELIEGAPPLSRAQRKVYLDYGTKAGR